MTDRPIGRRTFALGTLGMAAGATALTGAIPARAAAPFYARTILWDSSSGSLANYHVHGLTVLPDDTILAFAEGRHEVCDAGPRALLVRRSTDKGITWSASEVVVPSVGGQSWGNPALVCDRTTGEVFLFYALSERLPQNTSCSGDTGVLHVVSSTDGGLTWGQPTVLADLFDHFDHQWTLHAPGPGHGIQLDNGWLLMNVAHRRVIVGNTVAQRMYGVASIYSDDHGRTWQATGAVPVSADYPINEARLVQRADGSVLINGRAAAGGNRQRIISVSHDRGLTWSPPKLDGATGTFNAVDAGLLGYSSDRILFSRPDAPTRHNMTVSVSYDDGHSFRYSRVVNPGRSYYSDLARLSDGTIVLIYGRDGDIPSFPLRIYLARFNLEWLTQGRDSLATGPGISEEAHNLAGPARHSGGTVEVVQEPTARHGARVVFTPAATGDHLEYLLNVDREREYDLLLRYYRTPGGGLVTVTVDGAKPRNATIDTTSEHAEGYDVLLLGTIRLTPGPHTVRFTPAGPGRGGGRSISLDELSLIHAPARADVNEDITVDNGALGYTVVSGTWSSGTGVAGYYGGNYAYHPPGDGSARVRWRPALPADARYEVKVSYTAHSNRSRAATYVVRHAAGSTPIAVNQTVRGTPDNRGGEWVSLGTFRFTAGLTGTVELRDAADGHVIADAVRFARRD
ncbi:exo-alpha-sialidase [Nonomuraea sp. NPDC050404]|uniref:golvesin C-terminal-like domain-containing protein n=1 Tax=Nonomuraea sp. NPDC050404 TaxID=3155783 RepID=UPI0033CA8810